MGKHITKGYTYLFGPVPSRRLGVSLGVDLVLPKTCSLDCVYCESGRTTALTLDRSLIVPPSAVIDELSRFLSSKPALDHITFSGCGEPLLNSGIAEIAAFVKRHHPGYVLALLTNGTLFHRADVRKDVRDIDVIIASLDAVSPDIFTKINRPAPGLDPALMIQGLMDLRKEYSGQLWLEIFVVPGLNDRVDELEKLSDAARKIGADRIQLNSLDRPGTEDWVKGLTPPERERISGFFKGIELIGGPVASGQPEGVTDAEELDRLIISLIRRRPSTVEDIQRSTGADKVAVEMRLELLMAWDKVTVEKMKRGVFYKIVPASPI